MYSLIEKLGLLQFLRKEALPFLISLTIAELLYRFGSFTLECISFLVTWYIIGNVLKFIQKKTG